MVLTPNMVLELALAGGKMKDKLVNGLEELIEEYRNFNQWSGDDRADIETMRTLAQVADRLEKLLGENDD